MIALVRFSVRQLLLAMVAVAACVWVGLLFQREWRSVERFDLGNGRVLVIKQGTKREVHAPYIVEWRERGELRATVDLGYGGSTAPPLTVIRADDLAGIISEEHPSKVYAIFDFETGEFQPDSRTPPRKAAEMLERLSARSGQPLSWDWPK